MAEDMTYATEPTRAQLAARVAELERENAELRARLALVSEYAVYYAGELSDGDPWELLSFTGWLAKRHQPDDDTDAPLKLATVEGDDE